MKPGFPLFVVAVTSLLIATATPVSATGAAAGEGVLQESDGCRHDVVLEATGAVGTWSIAVESKRQYDGVISPNIITFPRCFLQAPQAHASVFAGDWDPSAGGCLESPADSSVKICLTNPKTGSLPDISTSYSVSLTNHVPGATLSGSMDLVVVSA